jgi:RecA/RadA recombinase
LDDALGGGILSGTVTEIYGEAGAGKTHLALQLCLTVQLPLYLGGLDGGGQ